jgi:hypothetical protein
VSYVCHSICAALNSPEGRAAGVNPDVDVLVLAPLVVAVLPLVSLLSRFPQPPALVAIATASPARRRWEKRTRRGARMRDCALWRGRGRIRGLYAGAVCEEWVTGVTGSEGHDS